MFEIQILIPRYDNNGTAFPASVYDDWERKIVNRMEGFTKLAQTVSGGWMEDGTYYGDESFVYVVALNSIGDGGDVIALAHYARWRFRQKAIFLRYLGVAEVVS